MIGRTAHIQILNDKHSTRILMCLLSELFLWLSTLYQICLRSCPEGFSNPDIMMRYCSLKLLKHCPTRFVNYSWSVEKSPALSSCLLQNRWILEAIISP